MSLRKRIRTKKRGQSNTLFKEYQIPKYTSNKKRIIKDDIWEKYLMYFVNMYTRSEDAEAFLDSQYTENQQPYSNDFLDELRARTLIRFKEVGIV